MKVLICGSRDFPYQKRNVIHAVLGGLLIATPEGEPFIVIQGGATGADAIAKEWAVVRRNVTMYQYDAEWDKHGKAAGPIRNETMLKRGKPDMVWGFSHKPMNKSRGTRHMLTIAREAGVATMLTRV